MGEEIEMKVCPAMRCGSINIFPEFGMELPCAKHGLLMVPVSEQPLRKTIYRFFSTKVFKFKYATHKIIVRKHPKISQRKDV